MRRLLTTFDLAELLSLHVWTVRKWNRDGILPDPVSPTSRSPRWLPEAIEAWLEKGGRPARLKAYKRKR